MNDNKSPNKKKMAAEKTFVITRWETFLMHNKHYLNTKDNKTLSKHKGQQNTI